MPTVDRRMLLLLLHRVPDHGRVVRGLSVSHLLHVVPHCVVVLLLLQELLVVVMIRCALRV